MPVYHGSFTWQKSDGSSEKITVPGRYSVSPEDTMIITSTLPEDYDSNTLAVRSSLQSVRFYINGKLRSEYDTKDTRLAGKNSASRYVFCKTSDADAGKELRIELRTNTKQYSGVVNTVYCGDKIDIWEFLFTQYGMETITAFFLLFASVITIIFSIMLGLIYHTKFDMEYLGWCMLMGSIWMLGESKFRQLLVPHSSALATLCFIILMLSPLPVLFYADQVQHRKYRRLYLPIGWLAIFNFIISTILHLTGIADYYRDAFCVSYHPPSYGICSAVHICTGYKERKKAPESACIHRTACCYYLCHDRRDLYLFCCISLRYICRNRYDDSFLFKCASHRRKYTYDGTPASEKRTGQTETSD